jgi:probable phosphoglycerate mutase
VSADLGSPTTLILVRHGRTDDIDQRRVRGGDGAGPSLNAAGRRQVERLAQVLAESAGQAESADCAKPADRAESLDRAESADGAGRPGVIVASPLLRAWQTATALGEALGLAPVADDDWAELSLGEWDGLSYAEIAAGWPTQYRAWRASTAVAPPLGESLDDVGTRVAAARERLVRDYPGQRVIVVSHTAPIRTVIAGALDAGPAALWQLRIDPARVSVVRFWTDGGCEVASVNTLP